MVARAGTCLRAHARKSQAGAETHSAAPKRAGLINPAQPVVPVQVVQAATTPAIAVPIAAKVETPREGALPYPPIVGEDGSH